MTRRSKDITIFNISFLDVISGALGAVIILFIAVPKQKIEVKKDILPPKVANCNAELGKIQKCNKELEQKEAIITKQEKTIEELEIENMVQKSQEKSKNTSEVKQDSKSKDGKKQVGFNFKGKRIVFLIDISGSMIGDKIGEVKAGLKMLIASMGAEYEIDVVYFPHSRGKPTYSLWGMIQSLRTSAIKSEVYQFIRKLRPRGGTPTKGALEYVFNNYEGITDIVLLSDGVPSDAGKQEIIEMIKRRNRQGIQINTIGVGLKEFNNNSQLYAILEAISGETKGFNYGF